MNDFFLTAGEKGIPLAERRTKGKKVQKEKDE